MSQLERSHAVRSGAELTLFDLAGLRALLVFLFFLDSSHGIFRNHKYDTPVVARLARFQPDRSWLLAKAAPPQFS